VDSQYFSVEIICALGRIQISFADSAHGDIEEVSLTEQESGTTEIVGDLARQQVLGVNELGAFEARSDQNDLRPQLR